MSSKSSSKMYGRRLLLWILRSCRSSFLREIQKINYTIQLNSILSIWCQNSLLLLKNLSQLSDDPPIGCFDMPEALIVNSLFGCTLLYCSRSVTRRQNFHDFGWWSDFLNSLRNTERNSVIIGCNIDRLHPQRIPYMGNNFFQHLHGGQNSSRCHNAIPVIGNIVTRIREYPRCFQKVSYRMGCGISAIRMLAVIYMYAQSFFRSHEGNVNDSLRFRKEFPKKISETMKRFPTVTHPILLLYAER